MKLIGYLLIPICRNQYHRETDRVFTDTYMLRFTIMTFQVTTIYDIIVVADHYVGTKGIGVAVANQSLL